MQLKERKEWETVFPTCERWKIGDRISDDFKIERIIGGKGKSGMGIVYVCRYININLPLKFVFKTFQDRFLFNQDIIKRFIREAEVWINLERHSNIVFANYVTEIMGKPYILLEYIDGGTIRELIRNISLHKILDISIQFCTGMEYACKRIPGLVHRDIKPENILINKKEIVKISDFGLVGGVVAESILKGFSQSDSDKEYDITQFGALLGTLPYMSPEQFDNPETVEIQSDIYAFGVVLYELLTSRLPFNASTIDEWHYKHSKEIPQQPTSMTSSIPTLLNKIVIKCLQKKPQNRFYNFAELKDALLKVYRNLTQHNYVIKAFKDDLQCFDWINKGSSYITLEKYDEAIFSLKKAIEIDSNNVSAYINMGIAYQGKRLYEQSKIYFKKALELDNNNVKAHVYLGKNYAEIGELKQAFYHLGKALKLDSKNAQVYQHLGSTYHKKGDIKNAIDAYEKALKIDPYCEYTYFSLAALYQEEGDVGRSIELCQSAININPRCYQAYYNMANTFCKNGEMDAAIECLNKVIECEPDFSMAYNNLGWIYMKMRQYDRAKYYFRIALKKDPRCAKAHFNLGGLYMEKGEYKDAVIHLKEVIQLDPQSNAGKEAARVLRLLTIDL
jgi:tetratricopeptide (TPR) repeat protein